MEHLSSVERIAKEAQELSYDELLILKTQLDMIVEDKRPEPQVPDQQQKKHSILEFRGIAKHLADDEDPQDYVNRLRSEWSHRP